MEKAGSIVRCSYCLSPVKLNNGIAICPSCGEQSEVRTDDGALAVFETTYLGLTPAAFRKAGLAALLGILIGAAVASYLLVFRPEGADDRAQPLQTVQRSAKLADIPPAFSGPARASIRHVLATGAQDRAIGFAPHANGAASVLVRSGAPSSRAELYHISASGTLSLRELASGESGQLLDLTGDRAAGAYLIKDRGAEAELSRLSNETLPAWQHVVAGTRAGSVRLSVSEPGVLVSHILARHETLSVSMISPEGAQIWQRSFPAGPETRVSAVLGISGQAAVLLQAQETGQPRTARLVRLDAFGQVVSQQELQDVRAPITALLLSASDHLYLLSSHSVPTLTQIDPLGAPVWTAEISEAVLSDKLFITEDSRGGLNLIWSYQLADVQTDIGRMRVTAQGQKSEAELLTFPPGAMLRAVQAGSQDGIFLLSDVPAEAGEGSYILLQHLTRAPGFAPAPLKQAGPLAAAPKPQSEPAPRQIAETQAEPDPDPAPSVRVPDRGPAPPSTKPERSDPEPVADDLVPIETQALPETAIDAPAEAADNEAAEAISETETETVQCRFVCMIDGEPLGSWQAVEPGTEEFLAGSPQLHERVCARLGGEPGDEAPRCR